SDEKTPRISAAVFADDQHALVGAERNAVGLVDAAGGGGRARHAARTGRHFHNLAGAGVSEVNPAGLRDDQIVWLHVGRDGLNGFGRRIDHHDAFYVVGALPLHAAVELAVGAE